MKLVNIFRNIKINELESFKVKELILDYANKNCHEFVDMSRGDPCYPPSIKVQEIFSTLSTLSTVVQKKIGTGNSVLWNLENFDIYESLKDLEKWFDPNWLDKTREFIKKVSKICFINEKNLWSSIIRGFQSTGYGLVEGEEPVREVLSRYLLDRFKINIGADNIVLTLGAAEGIGKLFEMFIRLDDYLKPNDYIAYLSPVYGPYNAMVENIFFSGKVIGLEVSKDNNFEPNDEQWDKFEKKTEEFKPKVFVLVNPNNPTGRSYSKEMLQRLVKLLKNVNFGKHSNRKHIPIIEDIVYADFVKKDNFYTVTEFYPEATIVIGSMSKYFRATGNRLGFFALPPEANNYFSTNHFKTALMKVHENYKKKYDFLDYFKIVKGPDPSGALYHTHLVPKIAQYLSLIKLVEDDGKDYLEEMKKKWERFYSGINYCPVKEAEIENFVPYYCFVNFKDLIQKRNLEFPKLNESIGVEFQPDHLISYLTKNGLVSLPAVNFFVKEQKDRDWWVRFSVANIEKPQIKKAINIINSTLKEIEDLLC